MLGLLDGPIYVAGKVIGRHFRLHSFIFNKLVVIQLEISISLPQQIVKRNALWHNDEDNFIF